MKTFIISLAVLCVLCTGITSAVDINGENFLVIKDLRILAVIYRGETNAPPKQRVSDADYLKIKNGIECSRLFYFRNSRGELNLTVTYLPIDKVAPKNAGPTYDYIVEDLRGRGYVDNQYDGIFTTGIGMKGNWGGFLVFDRTGAAFGGGGMGGQLRQFPSADTNTSYDLAWIFVHEFQHALDLAIAGGAGFDEFLHGHPYADNNEQTVPIQEWVESPGAQHWDWEACTLRNFKNYIRIPGATSSQIYVQDADNDGLADYHPILPMDEKRFGTSTTSVDTDRDGLSDLEEFMADKYLGSDPLKPDTDNDGLIDGNDPWPTVAIASEIGYAHPVPKIDGNVDTAYTPLITSWYATDCTNLASDAVQLNACWNEETLFLIARAPEPFGLELQIDTSPENGFWIGGDTYVMRLKEGEQPSLEWPNLKVWPGSKAVWSKDAQGNTVAEIMLPAVIGIRGVVSAEEFPEDTATALRLLAGKEIACNVAFNLPDSNKRVLLTPTWTMISIGLSKNESNPDLPTLRYSKPLQSSKFPIVIVEGVKECSVVEIKDSKGTVLGIRNGAGPVVLQEIKAGSDVKTGSTVLTAETESGIKSAPFTLVVDTIAKAPEMKVMTVSNTISTIAVTGESNAVIIIERKNTKGDWLPISSVVLDETGKGSIAVDSRFNGFRGEYFNAVDWTEPVFYRLDPVIDFDYQDSTPVKHIIDPDTFSIRWTGLLTVDKPVTATVYLGTDDGSILFIDGKKIIDNYGTHEVKYKKAGYTFTPGTHEIRIDYYEDLGWAGAHLEWKPEGGTRTNAIPVSVPGLPILRAKQKDVLGNESGVSGELTVE